MLTDQVTSRLPFWYPIFFRRETRRYLSDSQNGNAVNNVSLLSLSSYHQGGRETRPPLKARAQVIFYLLLPMGP